MTFGQVRDDAAQIPGVIDSAFNTRIEELRSEIKVLASEGKTWDCDLRHMQIAVLEEALGYLKNE